MVLFAREPDPEESLLRAGELTIDPSSRLVSRGGSVVTLAPREFELLEYLMRHAGEALSRTLLLESVWQSQFDLPSNTVDVTIARLRRAIQEGGGDELIETVRGVGYRLKAE